MFLMGMQLNRHREKGVTKFHSILHFHKIILIILNIGCVKNIFNVVECG